MNDIKEKYLIDKGWKQMSDLLDNNLPLVNYKKERKRRWLIFLLLFIFISTLTGYFVVGDGNIFGKNRQDKFKQKEELQQKQNPGEKNNFASLNPGNKDIVPDDGDLLNIKEITQSKRVFKAKEQFSKSNPAQKLNANRIRKSFNASKLKGENNLSYRSYVNLQKRNSSSIEPVDLSGKNLTEPVSIAGLEILKNKELKSDFELVYTKSVIPWTVRFLDRSTSHQYFTASLGVVSENAKTFGGVESGMDYNIDFSKNIGVSIGIDFSFLRKKGMSNSFLTNILNIVPYDGRYESGKIRKNSDFISEREEFNFTTRNPYTLSSFIDELYYVGLPVSVYYKNRKYRVALGLRTSYLLAGTNFTANKNYVGEQNYVINSDRAFVKSKVFNRMDYATYISFDYLIWKRFSVTGKFNYSITNILSSPEEQLSIENPRIFSAMRDDDYQDRYDKNIYFSLGLKYKL